MRAYNRGNNSSSFRPYSSNYHPSGRRYSNRREQQDTFSDTHAYSSYYETSSVQPDFSLPPPPKPSIDVSKSTLSAEAPEFVPRWQQNDNFNTTENLDQNFSYQTQEITYVVPVTYSTTEAIVDQSAMPAYSDPSTNLSEHESHEQFSTYVDDTTEPSTLHADNCEENVHTITEDKQLPQELNVEDDGIEEANEQEQVDCEQKTETNELKKESSHENRGNREQKQKTNYDKNNQKRRTFHRSETHENDAKSDDRKNNNHSKDGTAEVKQTSKRSTDTQSFVRQHPTRNSRGESGSFRRNQRKENEGKPEKLRDSKPSTTNSNHKSVHFQLPHAEITVPQPSTFRSFSQALKLGKPSQSSIDVTSTLQDVVDSVSQTSQIAEHLDTKSDTVDSPCPDTSSEVEQDNSKSWKKESIRPSNRSSITVSKLNFVEMPIGEDLFTAPETFSLAHCVGADFKMGMGIATIFKKKFQRVDELKKSKTKIGGVASLQDGSRFIFYLVTKEKSNIDPYFEDLQASLVALRDECLRLGIRKLAIPRLGCGLDKLHWEEVRDEIKKIFTDIEMEIRVYFIPYSKSESTS